MPKRNSVRIPGMRQLCLGTRIEQFAHAVLRAGAGALLGKIPRSTASADRWRSTLATCERGAARGFTIQ